MIYEIVYELFKVKKEKNSKSIFSFILTDILQFINTGNTSR